VGCITAYISCFKQKTVLQCFTGSRLCTRCVALSRVGSGNLPILYFGSYDLILFTVCSLPPCTDSDHWLTTYAPNKAPAGFPQVSVQSGAHHAPKNEIRPQERSSPIGWRFSNWYRTWFFMTASELIILFHINRNKSNKRPDSITWSNEHLNKMPTTLNIVILKMLWHLYGLQCQMEWLNDELWSKDAVVAYRITIIARWLGRLGNTMKILIRTVRLWAENQNQNYLDSKQECQPLNSNFRLYRKVKPGALGNRYCWSKRKTWDKSRVMMMVVVVIVEVTVVAVVVPWNTSP